MKVRNKISGVEFDTTKEQFDELVVSKGNEYKYEVVGDDVPFEVRSLREARLKSKEGKTTVTEAKLDDKKKSK